MTGTLLTIHVIAGFISYIFGLPMLLLFYRSNRRLRRQNDEMEFRLRRYQSAQECLDTMAIIRANQGEWPEVVFDR